MTHAVTERRTVMDGETQVIWSEFSHRLRAFIRQRVAVEADADDILQDVFLRIHLHAGGVNRADRLTSWLYQVTRNAIVDYYRAPARREQPESVAGAVTLEEMAAAPEVESDFDAARVRAELASCLRPMVERLPPSYREAVTLVDLAGLPQTQAAPRLGLSVSGMKSRVQRGRRALKGMLVDCCPVQLDSGGRVIDYDPPESTCAHCAGPGEDDVSVADPGNHRVQCCDPPAASAGEMRALDGRV